MLVNLFCQIAWINLRGNFWVSTANVTVSPAVGAELTWADRKSWKGIKNTRGWINKAGISYMKLNIGQLSSARRLATNPATIPAGIVNAPFLLRAKRMISFRKPKPERDLFKLSSL